MKKLIISLLLLTVGVSSFANTSTVTVAPGAFSLLSAGSLVVNQLIVVATTGTNATALLVDTATNTLTYVTASYTNTVSYITNIPVIYTNYFGVLTTNADSNGTNFVLVDVNVLVAAQTNSLPTVGVAATANNTVVINNMNTYFFRGLWVTNTGTGNMSVTASYTVK
jgi:hypothetical protein